MANVGYDMKKLKTIKEETSAEKVSNAYYKVLELVQKFARQLSDDDAYELHERLKKFFERSI